MGVKMIDVGKQFAVLPGGRKGERGGERFRVDILVPALKESDQVEVDLDGTLGLGSSFLDEAFGGLVREHGYTASQLKKRLKIKFSIASYVDDCWGYINKARPA